MASTRREPADAVPVDHDRDRIGIHRVLGIGHEVGGGRDVDAAVATLAAGECEQRVLVASLADDLHRLFTGEGHRGRRREPSDLGESFDETGGRGTRPGAREQACRTAAQPAAEAVPAAPVGVDVERRMVVVVERAEVLAIAGHDRHPGACPGRGEVGALGRRALHQRRAGATEHGRADLGGRRHEPRRGRAERDRIGIPAGYPLVPVSRAMDARRRDHQTSLRLHVETGDEVSGRDRILRGSEPEMATTASGPDLHGVRQGAPGAFPLGEAFVAAVAGIDVEHDDARDRAGDHPDVRRGPASPPGLDLRGAGDRVFEIRPRDPWMLPG